jgi:hypothetical protein
MSESLSSGAEVITIGVTGAVKAGERGQGILPMHVVA